MSAATVKAYGDGVTSPHEAPRRRGESDTFQGPGFVTVTAQGAAERLPNTLTTPGAGGRAPRPLRGLRATNEKSPLYCPKAYRGLRLR